MPTFSGYQHTLVPIFHQPEIPALIDMATLLTAQDGKVTALVLFDQQDLIAPSELLEEAKKYTNAQQAETTIQLEAIGMPASWNVRGILDTVREARADLLLLPFNIPSPQEPTKAIGNLLSAASCPVILYASHPNEIQQIVAIKHRSEPALPTTTIANYLHSQLSGASLLDTQLGIDQTNSQVDQNKSSLVVTYLDTAESQEKWLRDQVPAQFSRENAHQILIFAPHKRRADALTQASFLLKLQRWLTPRLTMFEKEDMVLNAELSATATLDYTVLIIISALLAGLGLLLSSNAVIIGAMLVAPLMSPLISFATGMAVGRVDIVRRATISLFEGIGAALLISILLGSLSLTELVTPEMAARGNPTILDLGVAVVSGVIGGYAAARRDVSSALAGVAIAAALMPPLVTVGLAISFGNYSLAVGSGLLFTTNIVSIILSAWGTLFVLGIRPIWGKHNRVRQRTSAIMVTLFVIILILLIIPSSSVAFSWRVESVLQDSFQQSELIRYEMRLESPLYIRAFIYQEGTNSDTENEIIRAEETLEETLGEDVLLDVIVQPIVRADILAADQATRTEITDVLTSSLTTSELIAVRFQVSNPTVVVALVEPDDTATEEEINANNTAAEEALQDALNLPVLLFVVPVSPVGDADGIDEVNESIDVIVEETLISAMPSMSLLNYSFQVGNPTRVTAYVSTELEEGADQYTSEVLTAELQLSYAIGLPVQLTVIPVTSVTTPATPLPATPSLDFQIESTIRESLRSSRLVTFDYSDQGDAFDVSVTLRTAEPLDSPALRADVIAMQLALEGLLDVPVNLTLTIIEEADGNTTTITPEQLPTPAIEATPTPEEDENGEDGAEATETPEAPTITATPALTVTVPTTATATVEPEATATLVSTVEASPTPTIDATPSETPTSETPTAVPEP